MDQPATAEQTNLNPKPKDTADAAPLHYVT